MVLMHITDELDDLRELALTREVARWFWLIALGAALGLTEPVDVDKWFAIKG
ncbi:hypothetical protein LCGC14_2566150 [marine sediment metagenome]|uniref:Uncharacterized protein n=1 Tax=marine sediment metagenome TaxID=412755 RepID=A0A0F9AJ45_9ZZZZ